MKRRIWALLACLTVFGALAAPVAAAAPDPPTSVVGSFVSGDTVSVSWVNPVNDGGQPITSYTVNVGGVVVTNASSPQSVSGVPVGSNTVSVSAINVDGSGVGSGANVVVPAPATVPGPPTGVTAVAAGVDGINVSWTAPGDNGGSTITGYSVTLGGVTQIVAGTSASFTSLSPGSYSASVTANNAVGSSTPAGSNPIVIAVPATVPGPPTGVTAVAAGVDGINVSWTAPGDNGGSTLTGYSVTLGGVTQIVAGTSASFTSLSPGSYSASVTANNAVGSSTPAGSNPIVIAVPATVPGPPTGVTAVAAGVDGINVSWTAPGDNGGSTLTGYSVTLGGVTQIVAGTSASFTSLSPGSYSASVTANNAVGSSTPAGSNPIVIAVPATVPGVPAVAASPSGVDGVLINWVAPADGGSTILDYTVTLSPGGFTQTVSAGTTSHLFTGVTPGAYTASVSARNAVGSGDPGTASVNVAVPDTAPSAPTGVGADLIAPTGVSVTWSAPADDGGSPVTTYTVTLNPGGTTQTTNGTSAEFLGLTRGTTYTASVVANNAVGPSVAASSNAVLVPAPAIPDPPTNVALTVLANNQLFVSWDAAQDNGSPITGYVIFLNGVQQTFNAGVGTTATLNPGPGSYVAVVVAVNGVGFSAPSADSNSVLIASAPNAPDGVSASVSGSNVTISWNTPANNGSRISSYTVTLSNGASQVVSGNSATFTLPPGTYTGTVTATNAVGTSTSSAASNPVTVVTAAGPPTSLDATASGANVTVVWAPPLSDGGSPITAYVVTLTGPTATSPVTVTGAPLTASFPNLGPGSYTASVVAVNAQGSSSPALVNVSVGALTPSAPREVTAVSQGQDITVSWLAPSDGGNTPLTGYEVTLGLLVKTIPDPDATSTVFLEVPEGGPYTASVRAINAAGAGDAGVSNEVSSTRPLAPFFSSEAFVVQQYSDFLGRGPDRPGLNFWMGVLDDPANASLVIESFMASPEFAPRRQIARLYLAYFDRAPDRGGFDFWSELFISRQATLGEISAEFANSQEFQNTYGELQNVEFVALVYAKVLLRAPDGPGLTYWKGLLDDGMSRGDMMVFFSESAEFIITSTPPVDVIVTYRGMLDRAPDDAGYVFWTRAVSQSRDSLRDLIEGFLISPEYSNRITP